MLDAATEIERLRDDLASENRLIVEREKEIERLRGLLIEWESNDTNGVLTFRQRVREALEKKNG